jgi:ribonuclease E
MSRQRLRPPVVEGLFQQCGRCDGRGLLRTPEAATVRILRAVHGKIADGSIAAVRITAHQDIAVYLLNKKRKDLGRLEREFACAISVEVKADATPDFHTVEFRAKTEEERAIAWAQRVSREKRQDFEEFVESQEPANAEAAAAGGPDAGAVAKKAEPGDVGGASTEAVGAAREASEAGEAGEPEPVWEAWHDEIPIEVHPAFSEPSVSAESNRDEPREAPVVTPAAPAAQRPQRAQRAHGARGERGREPASSAGERADRRRDREPERANPPEPRKPWAGGGAETTLFFPQPPYDPSLHFGIPEWGRELTLASSEGGTQDGPPRDAGGREDDADGGQRRRRRRGGRGRRRPSPSAP